MDKGGLQVVTQVRRLRGRANEPIGIVSSPLGIGGAEVFQKMAVWRGKVFFPKPEGAYSYRGGRGAKVFSYITDK